MMTKVKLVITDIDGVWTDGGMYYGESGEEFKKFSVRDGWGVRTLQDKGIAICIMTGEHSQAVLRRATKLKVEHCQVGVQDKLAAAQDLTKRLGISLDAVAFIGDDLNDLALMKAVGYSGAPSDCHPTIREEADVVVDVRGGHGAFRAFVDHLDQARLIE